jgi:hypothetical protein
MLVTDGINQQRKKERNKNTEVETVADMTN